MKTEIKRNNWTRFCKKFNQSNQYRQATVSIKDKNKKEIALEQNMPLLGIAITKKGRLIDGIDLFTDRHNADIPTLSVKQLSRIILEKDREGTDHCLIIESKDGTRADVLLNGQRDPRTYHNFVEKLAYSYYEQRGYSPGNDQDDWKQAEQKIKETELLLTK